MYDRPVVFLRYNFQWTRIKKFTELWNKSAWTGSIARLTRMRVLYREIKLTGPPGKIERSADALQVGRPEISIML